MRRGWWPAFGGGDVFQRGNNDNWYILCSVAQILHLTLTLCVQVPRAEVWSSGPWMVFQHWRVDAVASFHVQVQNKKNGLYTDAFAQEHRVINMCIGTLPFEAVDEPRGQKFSLLLLRLHHLLVKWPWAITLPFCLCVLICHGGRIPCPACLTDLSQIMGVCTLAQTTDRGEMSLGWQDKIATFQSISPPSLLLLLYVVFLL